MLGAKPLSGTMWPRVRANFDRDREFFNSPIKVILLILLYANLKMADCRRWSLCHHHTGAKRDNAEELQDTGAKHFVLLLLIFSYE